MINNYYMRVFIGLLLLWGGTSIENLEMSERKKKVFQTGLFDNLTVQDAFTIIALYAVQLDIGDDEGNLVFKKSWCAAIFSSVDMTILKKQCEYFY